MLVYGSLASLYSIFVLPSILFGYKFHITNKRVIVSFGLFSRNITNHLERSSIKNISVSRTIIGQILGYGTLEIEDDNNNKVNFGNIAKPLEVKKYLNEEKISNRSKLNIQTSNFNLIQNIILVVLIFTPILFIFAYFKNNIFSYKKTESVSEPLVWDKPYSIITEDKKVNYQRGLMTQAMWNLNGVVMIS